MINIRFEEREKIGLQYALETLHGCSPFGQEKIRKLRYYSPDEREELETELYNVEQAAKAADALKPLYDRIGLMLCQVIICTVCNSPQLAPSKREKELYVCSCLTVERKLFLIMVTITHFILFQAKR